MLCTNIVLNVKTKTKNNFSWNSMNNLSSYCGLTDSRIRASDIDLPVHIGLLLKLEVGNKTVTT